MPLPSKGEGFARVVLLGVPGAGKTTLIRQLIGANPETERFPSTSVNRTTTFPTDVVLRPGPFEATVSFMSEHETRFEVEESLSAAIVEAVEGTPRQVARTFLEKSDMRFRLKYLLGDVEQESADDPYDDEADEQGLAPDDRFALGADDQARAASTLAAYLNRIHQVAAMLRAQVEAEQGLLGSMSAEDRNAALDLIEELAVASDDFLALVSDILDELRAKFDRVAVGRFERSATGWPTDWRMTCEEGQRGHFMESVTYFSGISCRSWRPSVSDVSATCRSPAGIRPITFAGLAAPSIAETASKASTSNGFLYLMPAETGRFSSFSRRSRP